MTISNQNWVNFDPIEEEDIPATQIQEGIKTAEVVIEAGAQPKLIETVWFGSKSAPHFTLNLAPDTGV